MCPEPSQELETEMKGISEGRELAAQLTALLKRKDLLAAYLAHLRMQLVKPDDRLHLGDQDAHS